MKNSHHIEVLKLDLLINSDALAGLAESVKVTVTAQQVARWQSLTSLLRQHELVSLQEMAEGVSFVSSAEDGEEVASSLEAEFVRVEVSERCIKFLGDEKHGEDDAWETPAVALAGLYKTFDLQDTDTGCLGGEEQA